MTIAMRRGKDIQIIQDDQLSQDAPTSQVGLHIAVSSPQKSLNPPIAVWLSNVGAIWLPGPTLQIEG